ncbi:Uncharacterized protein TCM_015671 [Theobroma cacao]|uniref:Uncharacterized protein n=1 Tax=Theobroma cacao TaxID=3641 RepID=A0A061G249_THECC|nr:Uncharacterized protein TCM_015671 [Theobroma cacao]
MRRLGPAGCPWSHWGGCGDGIGILKSPGQRLGRNTTIWIKKNLIIESKLKLKTSVLGLLVRLRLKWEQQIIVCVIILSILIACFFGFITTWNQISCPAFANQAESMCSTLWKLMGARFHKKQIQ